MARIMNWIYGLALIYLALEAFTTGISIIPEEFLPFAVIIMGALILFTPISSPYTPPTFTAKIRRWVFGIAVVAMGVLSFNIGGFALYNLSGLTIYSLYGQALLALIGVIYLFAGTRTGSMQIRSA